MFHMYIVCFLIALWNVQIICNEPFKIIFIRVCVLQSWTFHTLDLAIVFN